jgi:hypothetical protein
MERGITPSEVVLLLRKWYDIRKISVRGFIAVFN